MYRIYNINVTQLFVPVLVIMTFIAFGFWMTSCNITPGFDDVPEISFIGLSADTINQGDSFQDSVFMKISFRDGDGDLGTGAMGIAENLILTDSRTKATLDRYKIPPLDITGSMTGIEGEITLKVYTTCCVFPPLDSIPPCAAPPQYLYDELEIDVQLIDDSGNQSNVVTSSLVTLRCI